MPVEQYSPKPPIFENIRIVGMHYRGQEAKDFVSLMEPGHELALEREPNNPYDPNAIKVMSGWPSNKAAHIGYVNREDASFIAGWMDDGYDYKAVFHETVHEKNNDYPIVSIIPIGKRTE